MAGFSALVVALLAVLVAPARAATTPGLVGAWSFDEPSGSAVHDLSGAGNDGTATGITRVAGKFGQAFQFNGSSSLVTIPDSTSLRLKRGMTISAWVKPSVVSGWRTVVLKEKTDSLSYGLYSSNDGSRPTGHVFTTRDARIAGPAGLTKDTWVFLTTTWDGTTQTLYVNGTKAASQALKGDIVTNNKPLRIGGNKIWTEWFKGAIDDVRIYNRALTVSEIKTDQATALSSLAAAPLPPIVPPIIPPVIPPIIPTPEPTASPSPSPTPTSTPSPVATTAPDRTPPSVPQGLTVANRTQTTVTLRWNAASDNVGVTGYRLYDNTTLKGTTTQLTYTYTGLTCGTDYALGLTAVDAAGNESYRPEAVASTSTTACDPTPTPTPTATATPTPTATAAPDTQAPSVPQGLTVSDRQKTTITLRWNAASDNVGVTGYRLYDNTTRKGTTTQLTYTFTGLVCGTDYALGLTAVDAAGNESYRPEAVASTSTLACDPTPTPTPTATPSVTPTPTPSVTPTPTPSVTPTPTPPAGGAATNAIAPSGNDSGSCTLSAPCKTFARAYAAAASGAIIEVRAGSYPAQTVPGGSKSITFRGLSGNKILQVKSQADNITFDGLDLDANRTTPTGAVFEHGGASNVTLKNSRVGNVMDEKGAMLGGSDNANPTNVVIDNVVFHDVLCCSNSEVHNECIMSHAPGITIRNSSFINCATMDISLGRGDWYGQPPYGNVVLENNMFGHSTNNSGSGWHYYGLAWFVGKFANARVVNNTFENSVRMEDVHVGSGPYSGVWANNIGGGWACLSGVTYRNNIGKKCDASDIATTPANSCGPPACTSLVYQPVGWVNPAQFDWRLKSGSIAINAASSQYAPATDRDGKARNGAPDAGAYEF